MNQEEALLVLSFHSGRNTNINDPRWENGFLPSLRKFDGKLNENSFIEIMECLKALTKMFESNKVDKNLMADLYTIFYYKMVDYLKKALIYGHTRRISS